MMKIEKKLLALFLVVIICSCSAKKRAGSGKTGQSQLLQNVAVCL